MGLLVEGEVLRATRPPALVRLAAGAALLALGLLVMDSLRDRGAGGLIIAFWCSIWGTGAGLLLFTGIRNLVTPAAFARVDDEGITFAAQNVRKILWKNLLHARAGLATVTVSGRRNTTTFFYRTPLILTVRDPEVLKGEWRGFAFRHPGHPMGDGTAEILIKMIGCPLDTESMLKFLAQRSRTKADLQPADPRTATLGGVLLNQPPKSSKLLTIGAVIFIAGGLFISGKAAFNFMEARQSLRWPATRGLVLSSDVVTSTSPNGRGGSSTTHQPGIRYDYEVNGHAYTGTRVAFYHDGTARSAYRIAKRFPSKSKTNVYYDPGDPAKSVLIREGAGVLWKPMAFGMVFATVGAGLLLLTIKTRRDARA